MEKVIETKKCKNCGQSFKITDKDLEFYNRIKVPPPSCCPDCRMQKRMAYRNERVFYHRKCDLCKKDLFSIYSPQSPCTVYCADCWWSDKWDPFDFGQDYDFNRPFFDQFKELFQKVPQLNIVNALGENDDYCNYCYRCKNSYLLIASDDNEDSYYCNYLWDSRNCMDCLNVTKSELCYELIDSKQCFNCLFSRNLENSNNCLFCFDLKGCGDCFGSIGLRQKSYCFFNEQLSKENYKKKIQEIKLTSENIKKYKAQMRQKELTLPHKFANLINCENSTGNGLQDCKNAHECYDSYGLEDSKFIVNGPGGIKDCYDFCGAKDLELSYEGISTGGPGTNSRFSCHTWNGCDGVTYCAFCVSGKNLFGCIGLKHKDHCILNKKYPVEEYRKLVEKIEKQMRKIGEFGEYFPITHCHFAYNETLAQEYYPLTKEEALKKGYRWKDPDSKETKSQAKDTLACQNCGKNYKIIPAEQKLYDKHGLPVPMFCPDCRHFNRMAERTPNKLFTRPCAKCGTEVKSPYSPSRPETVYCEKCYLKTVY